MKIEELIIDGFKSYATRTVISDWDPQFNAITGLNGSGKSNVLDAICFVLGIASMSTVRASSLQDLIYKRGQAGVTKASVTIVFSNLDPKNSPIGFENSPKLSVTRQVILGGTSKYLINGHRAPQQSVLQLFQSVQLNVNNPNFLIMQGKITKVLNMKPSEILSLIEEAAGTKMFEDRKLKAERTMDKKELKLRENRTLLQEEIEPQLEKLRNEKRIFLEFQEIQSDLEKIQRIVLAYEYHSLVSKQGSVRETLDNGENRIAELQSLIDKTGEEVLHLTEDLNRINDEKRNELDNDGKLGKLEKQESALMNNLSRLRATFDICVENINETSKNLESTKINLQKNQEFLESKSEAWRNMEKEYQHLDEKGKQLKESHSKKSELLSTLQTGISSVGTTGGGYNEQLAAAKENLQETEIVIQKCHLKIEHLNKELHTNRPKLERAKVDNEEGLNQIKKHKSIQESLIKELNEYGYDQSAVRELRQKEYSMRQELHNVERETEYLRRNVANIEFNYSRPSEKFDPSSVKGVAAQLFTLNKDNYDSALALQVCAGGRLFNVIVEDQNTASQLLEKGKLKKRVTIIPLNKIAARVINPESLNLAQKLAPGQVQLALNLVGYDQEVSRAMQYIFGNSLICNDAETAKKLTFHPQIRTRSITKQGDVYDPEGTLSGGSRNSRSTLLVDIQNYNSAVKRMKVLESELDVLSNKLNEQQSVSVKTKEIQNKLNLVSHKLGIFERSLNENPATLIIKRNDNLVVQIKECEEEIKQKQSYISQLQSEIHRIKADMEEFSHDKGTKLEKLKDEIDNLSREIKQLDGVTDKKYDLYQNIQLEIEQLTSEISSGQEALEHLGTSLKGFQNQKINLATELEHMKHTLSDVHSEVNEEKKRLVDIDEELEELNAFIASKENKKSSLELELQRLKNDITKFQNSTTGIEQSMRELLEHHSWLIDEAVVSGIIQQNPNINLKQYKDREEFLKEKYDSLKRKVNINIMSMIENVEKKETALKTMIRTIEKDKEKIQETIFKLNEYKKETLVNTWKKVTIDFGEVVADLLPNAFAKLVPCEGKEVTEGLEVKVKLGGIWKESLVELSGGQRSLIALSLIMALLQFRPAPMYILDEVDAALDLSHTQNIGHLIKTRFKGSQFIVVSLKEGMFSNASRVFRTRFQDGTSVVSIM
ncbi:structural maintenance of chromosomes protein 2 [Zygosaccharomyces mellis]|uniref:Structural maintenance of chromosomes protein n=1 Tax=Zygosaccharomyces mellis TaxID=42258 RepID=A0A4C2E1F2_9SACH|nr:structural maintenance of chromosomes protein 2 [Zygosaccharomyces mellis]